MGPPITNSSSLPPDNDPTLVELFGECAFKHRSCWIHMVAHRFRCGKKITWKGVEELKKKYGHTSLCWYQTYPHQNRSSMKRSNRRVNFEGLNWEAIGEGFNWMGNGEDSDEIIVSRRSNRTAGRANRGKNLMDTDTFECHLENVWKRVSEDKRMSFVYLDSLWFSLYRERSTKPKVLEWIKQKSILSKKYVFVPIVCWGHWSLLILVHPGESSDSETRTPCMLLLDSLENAEPKRLEPEIRKFVVDIYRAEGSTVDKKNISRIPLLLPKVPQQRNDEECGNYVLYFIKLFMEAAPENFSISNGYPYFMRQDWFNPEHVVSFCDELEKELVKKKPETISACISKPKLRVKHGVISLDD